MGWYRQGAVSIAQNSTAVTGTNTLFAANCRVGDGFIGPDGRQYEVTNVASESVISILPAYIGATVQSAAFAITPIQGYNKDSADAMRAATREIVELGDVGDRLNEKVDKVAGLGLSERSFTATEKTKLAGVADGATVWSTALTRTTTLLGFAVGSNLAIVATDSILIAFGKLQALANALKTGAFATVTTSVSDTTVGRIVKVGDFGANGGDAITLAVSVNWNTVVAPANYLIYGATGANAATPYAFIEVFKNATVLKQLAHDVFSSTKFERYSSDSGQTWTAWSNNLSRANILGTVSQTSGLPTGAIIETGANANGTYTKFADGSMMCTKTLSFGGGSPTTKGALFCSATVVAGAPAAAFIGTPSVTAGGTDGAGGGWPAMEIFPGANSLGAWSLRNTASTTAGGSVTIIAIGRWF